MNDLEIIQAKKEQLESKLPLNRKRLMKRSWHLVKTMDLTISEAMKLAHAEIREYRNSILRSIDGIYTRLRSLYFVELHPDEFLNRSIIG